jgi:hypothetical protein
LETKKRIYLGLLLASVFLGVTMIGLVWYLFSNRDILASILMVVLVAIAVITSTIMLIGIAGIIIIIIRSRTVPSLENIARAANDILFPFTFLTGKIFGIKRDRIQSSYIAVNNFLVTARKPRFSRHQVMILVPHCLQNSECPHKITMTVDNCKQCGKCKIGELKELAKKYQVILKVATGGTLARRFIEQSRPKGVVAVACERDLSLGIQDTGILPVIGVLNERPNGPCINTSVKVENVEKALETLCKGDE